VLKRTIAALPILAAALLHTDAYSTAQQTDDGPLPRHASQLGLPQSSPILDFKILSNKVLAVGPYGLILKGEIDGERISLKQVSSPTDVTLTTLAISNDNLWFAGGHEGTILKSQDGGENWTITRTGTLESPIIKLLFINGSIGLAAGGNGTILRSTDGGNSWVTRTLLATRDEIDDFDPHIFDLAMVSDGSILAAAEGGYIFRSGDQGNTWQAIQTPYPGSLFSVSNYRDGETVAFGMLGHGVHSFDGGRTWKQLYIGLNQSVFTTLKVGSNLFLGGAEGLLARLTDGHLATMAIAERIPVTAIQKLHENELIVSTTSGLRIISLP